MSNHQQIKNFVDFWRGSEGFEVAATGNCTFKADITYCFAGQVVEDDTVVTIIRNGYQDGRVALAEGVILSPEIFHLDFSPDFQRYKYDKSDHALQVEGSSPKMRGTYKVVIAPRCGLTPPSSGRL
jgi:hypothetical protein